MARTRIITDEQILDAARAVFLEEGFGAPTARIAAHAGISEGSIFKRFETKQALFLAALRIPHPPAWYQLVDDLVGKGDVRENLTTIAVSILTYFQHTIPQALVAAGSRVKMPPFPPPHEPLEAAADLPLQDLNKITGFLRREIELGRLCPCDPDALARLFFGALSNPFLMMLMLQQTPDECRTFAHATVGILWDGIRSGNES